MNRVLAFVYGVACYAIFFLTFLYLVGFLGNVAVPKGIDDGTVQPFALAAVVNSALILLFGLQHSVMARPAFKARWTRIVPQSIERSTYVLLSSVALIVLYWLWQPMPGIIWQAEAAWAVNLAWALYAGGFLLVLLSTLVIDHFDLFGLKQVFLHLTGRAYRHPAFRVTYFYRFVRHPLYLGWFIAFWATPVMTVGHLLFAVGMCGYILVAVRYEERDLEALLGEDYHRYRERVPMLVPRVGKIHEKVTGGPPQTPATGH